MTPAPGCGPSPGAPTLSCERPGNVWSPWWAKFACVPREQRVEILAEMVANVLQVAVEVGDVVEVGDIVVLLESMKMEIPVIAEASGTVTAVKVADGDVVQEGDPLVELTA